MSIYNRAVVDAPKVDRRIVRAVNLVSVAIPVPGGVFGLEDVWRALQALAKKERVPLDATHGDVSKALDALVKAGILTCRGGAYSVRGAKPEAAPEKDRSAALYEKMEALRAAAREPEPIAAPVVEVVEEHAEPVAAVAEEAPVENQAVLDLLAVQPMTTANICAALAESPSATRCRLIRLFEAGLIKRAGKVAAHDRPAMNVWALVEPRDQSAGPGEPDGGAEVEATPPPTPAQDPPPVDAPAGPVGMVPSLQAVVDVLQAGPRTTASLCVALGCTDSAIRSRLHKLRLLHAVVEVGTTPGSTRPMTVWGLPSALGTREVPSQPAAPAEAPATVSPPEPVKVDPWTARPKHGPDDRGRWYWEARATLEDRVSRGLGWLTVWEVAEALSGLEQPAPDPRLALLGQIGALMASVPTLSADQLLRQLSEADSRDGLLRRVAEAAAAEREVRALREEVVNLGRRLVREPMREPQRDTTGPAWPNLHSLDVDRDEAAIAEIERRCAAWRVLLRAAREVAA